MGAQQSVPGAVSAVPVDAATGGKPSPEVIAAATAAGGSCPLGYGKSATAPAAEEKKECESCKKDDGKSASACPVSYKNKPAAPEASSGCPVKTKGEPYKNPNVYNVYNQKIDPTNQMPAVANQLPSADQSSPLPVARESSSIPKGGTDSTWLYPSPQMFWNALVRKNKTEGVIEEDVVDVVRIHNNMNESTWKQILQWEELHAVQGEGREPRLLRFLGRPDELSPKARLKAVFGHAEPFDRHDWIVDRGGEEVRYIIDYYHDEAGANKDVTPKSMQDLSSIKSIKIDVRPALDSPGSVIDRLVIMPYHQLMGKTQFKDLPFFADKTTVAAEAKQRVDMMNTWHTIHQQCEGDKNRILNCKNERECENAAIALQRCTARVVCPQLAKDFDAALQAEPFDGQKTDRIYTSMVKCVELFEMDSKKLMSK